MAEIVTRASAVRPWLSSVTLLRVAIVLFVLAAWEILADSGLFYRGVLPPLPAIGAALAKLLSSTDFYWNVRVTAQ
jgi:ABC-type nitrate/sulfonate/bicarbonate transport system permease component